METFMIKPVEKNQISVNLLVQFKMKRIEKSHQLLLVFELVFE